jgi:lysophospholipase L1-like esterase
MLIGGACAAVLAVATLTGTVLAGAASAAAVNYVALGDSYSSGLGAGNYDPASGSCDRSANAYPEQWAAAHSPSSFTSVACAGATTSDVISGQVPALKSSTTLVSIAIGGNDANFTGVLQTCLLSTDSACLSAISTAEAFVRTTLPGRLDTVLRTIRAHSPSARVVVLGYPELYDLSRSTGCIGLSTVKRTAINQGGDQIDAAVSAAASRAGDPFADVRGQFSGHELCDDAGWLNAVTIPINASYHPTATGQKLGYLPVFSAAAG